MQTTTDEFLRYLRPQWARLHHVAGRYTASPADAPDLVQETVLRAWRNFSDADAASRGGGGGGPRGGPPPPPPRGSLGQAWLFVIMRSAAMDWHRNAKRRIKLVPASHTELTELAPADLTEPLADLGVMSEERFRDFLDDRIVAALDRLDEPFREVIVLSVAGGLTYREIAEVLDCPIGTVMSRMARARRALRESLAAYAMETGWIKESQP